MNPPLRSAEMLFTEHVTSCYGNCPFRRHDDEYPETCNLDQVTPRRHFDGANDAPPDWCPLRAGSHLVTLRLT